MELKESDFFFPRRTSFSFTSALICFLSSMRKKSAAAAKSLQSCPTLCDSIDGSPADSPVPGILQARVHHNWEIEGNLVLGRKTWADTLEGRRGGSPEFITSPLLLYFSVVPGGRGERLVSVFLPQGSFKKTAHSLWNRQGHSFCSSMMIKKINQWGTKFNLLQQTLPIKPSSNSSLSSVNKLGGIPSANTKQASLLSDTGFKFLLKDT